MKDIDKGDKVRIVYVNERQSKLGFERGQILKVWVNYEDVIYLESSVKDKTSEDYFFPDQLEFIR